MKILFAGMLAILCASVGWGSDKKSEPQQKRESVFQQSALNILKQTPEPKLSSPLPRSPRRQPCSISPRLTSLTPLSTMQKKEDILSFAAPLKLIIEDSDSVSLTTKQQADKLARESKELQQDQHKKYQKLSHMMDKNYTDYVLTARGRGSNNLSPNRLHALRNARP